MKPTLLILAAGMGSRYGGLKQLDPLGPNGETIMDYSVSDAILAGFNRVVFVIRRNMEQDFKKLILSKYTGHIETGYVFQEMDLLPGGFTPNPERRKPYGTAHAILSAREAIDTPFAVINADDFYGRDAFLTLSAFLQEEVDPSHPRFAMIGYQLSKTLSENGTVARGVCQVDQDQNLVKITERYHIRQDEEGIRDITDDGAITLFSPDTPVSMNCWGFTPLIFPLLDKMFVDFLEKNGGSLTAEFPIPSVVTRIIEEGIASVKVLKSSATWFGVTYKEDREHVVERLKHITR